MKDVERRVFESGVELRSSGDGKRKIVGYAAKFNSRSVELWGFVEEIAPGAFDRALREAHDVRALVDHDPSRILGRSKAGTLRLSVDEAGLVSEIDPPDTQASRDIQVSLERGDVTGMSFGFRVISDEWRTDGKMPLRTIRDLELFDVSVVTYPAYPATEVSMRAQEQAASMKPTPPSPPLARIEREIGLIERS